MGKNVKCLPYLWGGGVKYYLTLALKISQYENRLCGRCNTQGHKFIIYVLFHRSYTDNSHRIAKISIPNNCMHGLREVLHNIFDSWDQHSKYF